MAIQLLSAALIVKDEAANITDCLESLRCLEPVLSEICVYDTGSSDGTPELARACGARVELGYWDNDFARARNDAIAMTSSRWVLIVDADERVVASAYGVKALLREATQSGVDGIRVMCANMSGQGTRDAAWPSARLLRSSKAHYEGRIHEQVVARVGGVLHTIDGDREVIEVRHHGYQDGVRLQQKLKRNAAIAHRQLEIVEVPGADAADLVRAYVDRGRSLVGAGRVDEGLADLERARAVDHTGPYHYWGLQQLASWLLDLGRVDEAQSVVGELDGSPVDPSYLSWLRARLLAARGELAECLDVLRGIDVLVNAIDARENPAVLLEARMEVAAAVGQRDEALVCAIRLVGEFDPEKYAGALLQLCGGVSAATVIALLDGSLRQPVERVARALECAGAADVAALIRSDSANPDVAIDGATT